jgi:hypothetical protein
MAKDKDQSGNWFGRHKIITGILVIIFISIIASAAGGSKSTTTSSSSSTPVTSSSKPKTTKAATTTTASTPGLNQPADDGKFQFTVTSIQCNQSQVESPDDSDIATSTGSPYCIVALTVKDISNVAQSFDSSSQYLYDSSNKQYSVDSDASSTFNPGTSISGQLVFDVPSSVTPVSAMLHDSGLSNGVKVELK